MKIRQTINVGFKDNYLQLNDPCFSRSSVREDNRTRKQTFIRRAWLLALPFHLRRNLQYFREHKHTARLPFQARQTGCSDSVKLL